MLPDPDTSERALLDDEAMEVALRELRSSGNLLDSLYATYMHFRMKFIEERGLMDGPPCGEEWADALLDGRILEACVARRWVAVIQAACDEQTIGTLPS